MEENIENKKLIENFYSSFQKLDYKGMKESYHDEIKFSDPVFPNLQGKEATLMWQMLCEQAKEFELTFKDIEANDLEGSAYWEAKYKFTITKKYITNKIHAKFKFKDGKIIEHTDSFDFSKWVKMAFGLLGNIFNKFLQYKVRTRASKNLEKYMEEKGFSII
jgi:limonene-1,2-epoxide hydrolase